MSPIPAETPSQNGQQRVAVTDRLRGFLANLSAHPELVAWAGFVLALVFLLIRLGWTDDNSLGMWLSSDTLYPVNVFTDVLRDGYSLFGWRFSIAPCWFPDMAATGLFWALTQNVILATLLAGFIQIGIIVAAFHLIGKAIGIRSLQLQDTLLLGSGIAITLYVAFHPGTYYPAVRQFFLPQTHVGSMLSVLYGWGMALWMIRGQLDGVPPRRWFCLLYAVLCLLAGMSNLLFVVHMLAPLTAALLFLYFFSLITLRHFWMPVVCGWAAAAAGALLNRVLFDVTDVTAQAEVSFERVLTSHDVFLRGFAGMMVSGDMLHIAAIAWAAVSIGYIACFLRRIVVNGRSQVRNSHTLTAAFFLASFSSGTLSVAAIVLGGSNGLSIFKDYVWSMHYLHQMFLFPLFALPAAFAWLLAAVGTERVVRFTSWTCATVALVVILVPLVPSQWPSTPIYAYRPPLVRFMDEIAPVKGLRHGYAGYWQARLITLLSRAGVRAYAVDGNLNPFLWVNNEEWYRQSAAGDRDRRPRVDFVVLDDPLWKISREAAVRVFGEPASEVRVQNTRVLLYKQSEAGIRTGNPQEPGKNELTSGPKTAGTKVHALKQAAR